jgi:hypothetical protein
MTTNAPSIDRFVDELRADPIYSEFADEVYAGLSEVDRKADTCPDHAEFFAGLQWLFQQPRPIDERLAKLCEFTKLEGSPVVLNMREWTGW